MSRRRAPIAGRYTAEEVGLAARDRGMPLEALRYDVTPERLSCRATDASGATQPLVPPWDVSGFGNNSVQRVRVAVRP